MKPEELREILWVLVANMTPEQIDAACNEINLLGIARSKRVQHVLSVLRMYAREPSEITASQELASRYQVSQAT
jgi:hypothetical protein